MTICCVVNCNSSVKKKEPGVKFYVIPGRFYETELRKRWIEAINRKNPDGSPWTPAPWSKVCSKHFIGGKRSTIHKEPNSVPTIFPERYHHKTAKATPSPCSQSPESSNVAQAPSRIRKSGTGILNADNDATSSETKNTREENTSSDTKNSEPPHLAKKSPSQLMTNKQPIPSTCDEESLDGSLKTPASRSKVCSNHVTGGQRSTIHKEPNSVPTILPEIYHREAAKATLSPCSQSPVNFDVAQAPSRIREGGTGILNADNDATSSETKNTREENTSSDTKNSEPPHLAKKSPSQLMTNKQPIPSTCDEESPDGSLMTPASRSKVCSKHFIGGKRSTIHKEPYSVPTILPEIYHRESAKATLSPCSQSPENFDIAQAPSRIRKSGTGILNADNDATSSETKNTREENTSSDTKNSEPPHLAKKSPSLLMTNEQPIPSTCDEERSRRSCMPIDKQSTNGSQEMADATNARYAELLKLLVVRLEEFIETELGDTISEVHGLRQRLLGVRAIRTKLENEVDSLQLETSRIQKEGEDRLRAANLKIQSLEDNVKWLRAKLDAHDEILKEDDDTEEQLKNAQLIIKQLEEQVRWRESEVKIKIEWEDDPGNEEVEDCER